MMRLLYPPKCALCDRVLEREELDLCAQCRINQPDAGDPRTRYPHLAKVICLWYYKERVRLAIHGLKFHRNTGKAAPLGRLLAAKLDTEGAEFDVLSYVPISTPRLLQRSYDQSRLLTRRVGKELGRPVKRVLVKTRHNRQQSLLTKISERKANVSGVYRCPDPAFVRGKRILLIDDILTTGATAGECARVLLEAGAKEVILGVVAIAQNSKNCR